MLISNLFLLNIIFYDFKLNGLYFNIIFFICAMFIKFKYLKFEYNFIFYLYTLFSLGIYLHFKNPQEDRFPIYLYLIFYFIMTAIMEVKFFIPNNLKLLILSYFTSIIIIIICFMLGDKLIIFDFFIDCP